MFHIYTDPIYSFTDQQTNVEEELRGARDRCESLERTGTPRPQWELCADFITGGRTRWRELARGLSSRDALRALLKELGPAGHGDTLEHFDGLVSLWQISKLFLLAC